MEPSRGQWILLGMCAIVMLIEQAMGKFKFGKGVKKHRQRNSGTTTENIVDPNEKWDPVRVLPRSKVLLYAYLKMHEVVPQIIPKAPRDAVEVSNTFFCIIVIRNLRS